jgi:hypothetical protein
MTRALPEFCDTPKNVEHFFQIKNMENNLEEEGWNILRNCNERNNAQDIELWNVTQVREWIMSLRCLFPSKDLISSILLKEKIDGLCLMDLTREEWVNLGLKELHYHIIRSFLDSYSYKAEVKFPVKKCCFSTIIL